MTAKELIEALKAYPPEVQVWAEAYDQSCLPIVGASEFEDAGLVLRTSDYDMGDLYSIESFAKGVE